MKALFFPRLNVVGHGNFLVYWYLVNSNNPKCIINVLTCLNQEYIKDSELILKILRQQNTQPSYWVSFIPPKYLTEIQWPRLIRIKKLVGKEYHLFILVFSYKEKANYGWTSVFPLIFDNRKGDSIE